MRALFFWTFQRKVLCNKLKNGEAIRPDWYDNTIITGSSISAYHYICREYNMRFRNMNASGLVFGYLADSFDTVEEAFCAAGEPSGAFFDMQTHSLLRVKVPKTVGMMCIDFYRFSDLLFFMEEGDEAELQEAKAALFSPNSADNTYQFPVWHIPYILPEWPCDSLCVSDSLGSILPNE